jgi:hypothetical protein
MTKKQLLETEAFINAPDDAYIEIPNWHYGMDGDEREETTPTEVRYWDFNNMITIH